MNKYLKYSLFGLGGLVALVLIIFAVVAATFNPNDYKPLIVKLVKEKKQRTLNIEGDIKLAFWPKIGADLGKVSLSEHESDKEFAAMDGAKVFLAVMPLLRGELVVDTVRIDGVRANIVRFKDGKTNLDDLLSKDEEESKEIKFDIDGVAITNAALNITDEMANRHFKFDNMSLKTGHIAKGEPIDVDTQLHVVGDNPKLDAKLQLKGNLLADTEQKHFVARGLDIALQGAVDKFSGLDLKVVGDVEAKPETKEFMVDGLKVTLTGGLQGQQFDITLEAPKLVAQQQEVSGKEVRLDLVRTQGDDKLTAKLVMADIKGSPTAFQSSGISGDISGKQGARSISGKFSSPFSGNLETLVFDLPKLVGNMDIKDPAIPNGEAKVGFNLKAHADIKQEKASSVFSLDVDNTRLDGDVTVAGFSQPQIKFNLNGDQLDLNKLVGNKSSAASSKSAATDKPTDLSMLKSLQLEGKVKIGSILYDKYRLSGLNLGVSANGEQLKINPFAVKFDDSNIKGSFGISRFADPVYNFDVDIDKLDADRYITKSEAKPAETAKPDPNAPIDLSALKKINANGELRIGWLKLANVKSTNVRIKLTADKGIAQLSPFSANLYDGSMAGTLKVDARTVPSIALKQDMKGISIGPLLVDAINNDMLSGKGTLSLDLTTQGATVGALKKALNGKAAVNLADGAVKGIDIAGTLRGVKDKLNVLKSQTSVEGDKNKKTDFSEMLASFNIRNGVAHNDDLSMKAPLFRITGAGDIDIANETINYLAKPTVVASLKGQGGAGLDELNGLTVPVKLTGTFTKPSYAIDFAGLATALAQKKVLDSIGGSKGEAVKGLIGGNKEDALKSLLGGKKKAEPPAATPGSDAAPAQAAPEQKPASKEDKAKQKLNKLLGL